MRVRRNIREFGFSDGLRAKGRRLHWNGLGWGSGFSGNIGGWNGEFFDGKHRLARHAVKQINKTCFGDLGDSVLFTVGSGEGDQVRTGGQIMIPEIVAQGLKMPEAFPGECIQTERAVGKEIVTFTATA